MCLIIPLAFMPRGICLSLSVCPFICSFLFFVHSFVPFHHVTSKFLGTVSRSNNFSPTTQQRASMFEPWVPKTVSFYAMTCGQGWGLRSKSRSICQSLWLKFLIVTISLQPLSRKHLYLNHGYFRDSAFMP